MKNFRIIIVIIICAALCIGYYFYLSNRTDKADKNMTEIELVISKDLDKSYPKTPRDVIKFYNRIVKCFYNEKYTEEELKQLGEQARKLMDEELLANNPDIQYYSMLQSDIEEFAEDKKIIINSSIASAKDIEFGQVEGRECAYVDSSYFIKGKKDAVRAAQTYILRKDDEGKWKVLGFYSRNEGNTAENE